MKKFACILMCVVVALSCFAMTASAADRADVLAELKAAMPAGLNPEYYVMAENILNQIDVDEAMAAELIAKVDEVKANVAFEGNDISAYAAETKDYIMTKVNEACEVMGVTATVSAADDGAKTITVTNAEGKKLGAIEEKANIVNKTNAPEMGNYSVVVIAPVFMVVLACVAVVISKRRLANAL